ncbi:MAG: ATPase, partial [Alphaproteobacteria bacterium]
ISLALGHRIDAAFIFAVLLINAAIGTFQERRADLGMEALQRLILIRTHVRRDGALTLVDAAELVPGDIVESGMAVPADLRIIESRGLQADESLLSGESLPVAKQAEELVAVDAGLGDRPTMLHAGTTVVEGRAVGLVVATGLATALGEIQKSLGAATAAAPPPLVLRLARLTR